MSRKDELAKVVVSFEAEAGRLHKELEETNRRLDKFSKRANRAASNAKKSFSGLAGIVSTGVLVAATKSALNYADGIADAAEKTAFTAKRLQELKFAAEQNGVQFRELEAGLARFTKRLGLARMGTGAAAATYKKLGIDLSQTNEQVFRQVVATLGGMTSETNRLALATRLFGDDAQRLAVVFKDGNKGLQRYADKARDLGLILSDKLVRGASDANDQLDIMAKVVQVQLTRGMVELAPVITEIGQAFADAAPKVAQFFNQFGSVDNLSVANLEQRAKRAQEEYARSQEQLARRLEINAHPNRANQFSDLFLPSEKELRQRMDEAEAVFKDAIRRIQKKNMALAKQENAGKPKAAAGLSGLLGGTSKGGKSTGQKKAEQFDKALKRLIDDLDPVSAKTREYMKSVALLDKAFFDGRISGERYDELMMSLATDNDALTERSKKLAKESENVKSAWEELGGTFSSALENAIVTGGRFSNVLRGLEQDILRIITRKTITEPLTYAITNSVIPKIDFGGAFDELLKFGGFRAAGGPVRTGQAYVVGEKGPELFMPRTAGQIVPNGAAVMPMAPAGGGVVVNINNNAPVRVKTNERTDADGRRQLDIMIEQIEGRLATRVGEGGRLAQTLEGVYGLNRAAGAY